MLTPLRPLRRFAAPLVLTLVALTLVALTLVPLTPGACAPSSPNPRATPARSCCSPTTRPAMRTAPIALQTGSRDYHPSSKGQELLARTVENTLAKSWFSPPATPARPASS